MSRHRATYKTIRVDAEVDIDEFDDDVVLEYALEVIMAHKMRQASGRPGDSWDAIQALVERLAAVLGITDMAPASTAAKVQTMEQLRALCGREAPAQP